MEKIKNSIGYYLLGLFIGMMSIQPLWAENLFFLDASGSARSVGVGGAYTALVTQTDALLWNPAGLVQGNQHELQMTYSNDWNEVRNGFIGGKWPINSTWSYAVAYVFSDTDGIILRDEDAKLIDSSASFKSQAALLGIGTMLSPDLRIGSTVKYIRKDFMSESNQGVSIDLGGKYDLFPFLTLAGSAKDINSPMIGPDKISPSFTTGIDIKLLANTLHLLTDCVMTRSRAPDLNTGIEWTPLSFVSIRGGYPLTLKTMHAGLSIDLSGIILDYAYYEHAIENSHRMTITLKWD